MSSVSREIRLASRPTGWPTAANFSLVTTEVSPPSEGQVLVRNLFMSVDPYMRGRMNDMKSYVPPYEIGQPLDGRAVGEVIESRADALKPGTIVASMFGWREYFVADAKQVRAIERPLEPLSIYLGVLGMPGQTAWVGLNLGEAKAGDVVFVSGAAGAVGSVAGQLAKLRGCTVLGTAGSPEKVRILVEELGFDAAFNYKDKGLADWLKSAAPDGIDLYFDNVGGEQLEMAISAMRTHGRIVACGSISRYNDSAPTPGPRNMFMITGKRLTIRGFIVTDWVKQTPQFLDEVGRYVIDGKVRSRETVIEGIERAPEAFIEMLRGSNIGKMVVKLGG
jgi:NADPH-dependent curcumin reductase CurA